MLTATQSQQMLGKSATCLPFARCCEVEDAYFILLPFAESSICCLSCFKNIIPRRPFYSPEIRGSEVQEICSTFDHNCEGSCGVRKTECDCEIMIGDSALLTHADAAKRPCRTFAALLDLKKVMSPNGSAKPTLPELLDPSWLQMTFV